LILIFLFSEFPERLKSKSKIKTTLAEVIDQGAAASLPPGW
jgi:hypothetical protein